MEVKEEAKTANKRIEKIDGLLALYPESADVKLDGRRNGNENGNGNGSHTRSPNRADPGGGDVVIHKVRGKYPCPVKGCDQHPSPTRQGIGRHLSSTHPDVLYEYAS